MCSNQSRKCYENVATSCHFRSGDTTGTDLTKLAGSKVEITWSSKHDMACESNCSSISYKAELGGSRRWHSKNRHFTAWSTDFLTRCATACCYGMQLRRFWWNAPRDEAVCTQIIQRSIYTYTSTNI